MKPYAIENCSRAQYNAIEAINQSKLKFFKDSPYHFKSAITAPPKKPTPAMVLGSLTDHLLFGVQFEWVLPEYESYRSDDAKAWKKKQEAAGIEIITEEMLAKAKRMVDRVKSKQTYQSMLPGRGNLALVGTHAATGLPIKCLLDWVPDNELLLADLKTSDDASLWGFGKKIADFGYLIQAEWYTDLFNQVFNELRDFGCFIVESEPPHAVSFQMMRPTDCARARVQIDEWMETYKRCLETDTWPEYPDEWQWAEIPSYYLKNK